MRILHVAPMYFPAVGGAELHLKELSERLASRGHAVTVVTANVREAGDLWPGRAAGLPDSEVINGVEVVRLPPDGGRLGALIRWAQDVRGGYRISRIVFGQHGLGMWVRNPLLTPVIPYILRSSPDIVATMNWYWPPAYHAYLARRLKRFVLVGIPLFHTAASWCNGQVFEPMLAMCDAVVANTAFEARFAADRGARRVEVAGVGIDPKGFEARDGEAFRTRHRIGRAPVVGFVGRQLASKGVFKLLRAMEFVWDWNDEVRLVLGGPRFAWEDVDTVVSRYSDERRERVINLGVFPEMDKPSVYDAFDVFALPSREESFGISYLEAWLCQKPVIGSDIGPTRCVISDGVDGLLVDDTDPRAIATAIIDLLSDEARRRSMGRSGYAKAVGQYTWDKVADRVEGLYEELVDGRRSNNTIKRARLGGRRASTCDRDVRAR
jgi:glycosyltransferase involved in cell wall biosynthesis